MGCLREARATERQRIEKTLRKNSDKLDLLRTARAREACAQRINPATFKCARIGSFELEIEQVTMNL